MAFDTEDIFRRPISGEPVVSLPSGQPPERRVLEGELIRIEPLDPDLHADELFSASHADETARRIWDFLPWGPWQELAAFTGWLRQQAVSTDHIWYAFRDQKSGRASGMACYLDIAPVQGVIEIGGIWFTPQMQRTRAASEALYLMMSYAMDDLAYRRLQWRCNARNEKSRNAARRLGYRFEGIFYNHMIVKGHNRDTAWYGITGGDWPDVRRIFQSWLGDDNFAADGVARQSLSALMAQRPA
jgi:RimJ/RimL family protein N-acetyltransferase